MRFLPAPFLWKKVCDKSSEAFVLAEAGSFAEICLVNDGLPPRDAVAKFDEIAKTCNPVSFTRERLGNETAFNNA